MSERLSATELGDYLNRDWRLWGNEHALLDHVHEFIIHKLDKQDFETESLHARDALRATVSLSKFEDSVAIAEHLVAVHALIQVVMKDSKVLELALEEAIRNPSDITLKRFEKVLEVYAKDEDDKLNAISESVATLKKAS